MIKYYINVLEFKRISSIKLAQQDNVEIKETRIN